ncbi:hypothetical protein N7472_001561 [Penicillium cf. griseofulvum]|uniref:Uncharacterized protein n=1 Tax=Penicillium cf. griseofulvum TaxID=2972120 RepID=A0A9W9N1F1_9EURO|nr:hypothetical protein N7472_001561 [Penicillium cf. griseofulvum]
MPLARTRSYFATEDTTAEQPSTDPATSGLLPRGILSIAVPEALPPAVAAQTAFVRYPAVGVRTAPRWESP